jgi:hypothetical protein
MRLHKQVADAGDALWRPIALALFPHLATTVTFFPGLASPYKLLFRRFYEAENATALSDPPEPEVLIVTLDDYVFHYDILASGEIKETWTGKGLFRNPGAANDAHILLPLSANIAKFMGEQTASAFAKCAFTYGCLDEFSRSDWLRLRTTITDIKTLKTAKIFFETAVIEHYPDEDKIGFGHYPVAHGIPGLAGVLYAEPQLDFWSDEVREGTDTPSPCFIDFKFRRAHKMHDYDSYEQEECQTQNEFLLELQHGSLFDYRTASQ